MRILDARLITIRRGNIITFDRDTTTNEQVLRNHLFREQIPFNQLHKNCSFVPKENGTLQEHPLLSMVPRRNPIPKESAPLCLSNETRSTDDGGSVVYRVTPRAYRSKRGVLSWRRRGPRSTARRPATETAQRLNPWG